MSVQSKLDEAKTCIVRAVRQAQLARQSLLCAKRNLDDLADGDDGLVAEREKFEWAQKLLAHCAYQLDENQKYLIAVYISKETIAAAAYVKAHLARAIPMTQAETAVKARACGKMIEDRATEMRLINRVWRRGLPVGDPALDWAAMAKYVSFAPAPPAKKRSRGGRGRKEKKA